MPAPLPAIWNAKGLLVLCIDNDEAIRAGMAALLAQWGHRTVCARDLEPALSLLGDETPDVVLIDYHLDGLLNGLDVLGELRRRWTNETLAILITADRTAAVQHAARNAGCEILHKPLKPAALRRYLNGAGLRRAAAAFEK